MSEMYKKMLRHKELGEYVFNENTNHGWISTNVIALNLLFSGKCRGGIQKGTINMFSADSSLGKSFVGLSILKEAQRAGMDCIVIDAEKSFDFAWARKLGIDTSNNRLPVIKTNNIIKIKQALQLCVEGKSLQERINTFILFDSWGPLVSEVMIKKAQEGSDTRDMSLPFWKNEVANILKSIDVTSFVVNHVYANTGGFGDPLSVPGGKRLYFNSENVVLGMSKAKDKEGDEITGAIITAITHKGRKAREKSKLRYRIKHEGGLDMFYGLLMDALAHGCVEKPTAGYYIRPAIKDDKKWREKDIYCSEFWVPIFQITDFETYMDEKYTYSGKIDIGEISLDEVLLEKTEVKLNLNDVVEDNNSEEVVNEFDSSEDEAATSESDETSGLFKIFEE
jgi:RecA/RadA recombinase